jgi:hypothetical protein
MGSKVKQEAGTMTGVEVLAGAAVGYLLRRLRKRDGLEVLGLDTALEELRQLLVRMIGDDSALVRLREQAEMGEVSERTKRRTADAIAEAAESDYLFYDELQHIIERLSDLDRQAGTTLHTVNVARDTTRVGAQDTLNIRSADS